MRLAHIVPTSMLQYLPPECNTHLCLANLVVEDPVYCWNYQQFRRRGDLVLLDNPVHENVPPSLTTWLRAIAKLRPTVAIVPDVIDDTNSTISFAQQASSAYASKIAASLYNFEVKEFGNYRPGLMAVPHGKTHTEFMQCAEELSRIPHITWLGLTLERRLEDDKLALERRQERLQLIQDNVLLQRMKIHLLGVSERIEELSDDLLWRRATSADTSKFAVYFMSGKPVYPPVPITRSYPGRAYFGGSMKFFETPEMRYSKSNTAFGANLADWTQYAEGR